MTWREIKLAALQKMFSADGSEIPTDTGTTDYLAAMPHAANEALQRLCTVGKFYRKCYETVLDGTVRKIDLKTDITDYYDFGNNLEIYLFDANGLPEPLDGCRVVAARYLILPDGLTGTLQISPSFCTGVFVPLLIDNLLAQATVQYGAITWPNGLDLAPDTMYAQIKRNPQRFYDVGQRG